VQEWLAAARNTPAVSGLEVQRTLVKSPPELWSELNDVATLARALDEQFGAVEITRSSPETRLEWRSREAEGTVDSQRAVGAPPSA